MRTPTLIALLSADATPPRPIAPRLLLRAGAGLLLAAVVLLMLVLGIRPDLRAALDDPVTRMKWLLPLAVALPALYAALRMTRPQEHAVPARWLAVLIGGGALLWWLVAAISAAPGTLWPDMRGNSAIQCLISITLFGLLPLFPGLRVLAEGASPAPARSGAMLGLACGGLAACVYALHCNEDLPLFFLTWYGIGILIVATVGALAGRRMLRW